MKTIAITIDNETLQNIDRLLSREGKVWRSRSHIIRKSVQEFVARLEQMMEEERERKIFRRHRTRLNRQAAALVKGQAKP